MFAFTNILYCCARYIRATEPDSLGHIFCTLECGLGCEDKNFCLSVKRLVEEELNRRHTTEKILNKQGG